MDGRHVRIGRRMKILVIGDEPSKSLWDFYDKSKLDGIDLILSSGDLPPEYLSFLVTFASCPVLYVHGNHDERYDRKPPEGCICIDGDVYEYEGVRILGLGGSMRYRMGNHQFTEREMKQRVLKLFFKIWKRNGFDILLTHAPARGINDQNDLPHQGFEIFRDLMRRYEPKYMVHGHVHMNYGHNIPREQKFLNTTVVNSYEKHVIEI